MSVPNGSVSAHSVRQTAQSALSCTYKLATATGGRMLEPPQHSPMQATYRARTGPHTGPVKAGNRLARPVQEALALATLCTC